MTKMGGTAGFTSLVPDYSGTRLFVFTETGGNIYENDKTMAKHLRLSQ